MRNHSALLINGGFTAEAGRDILCISKPFLQPRIGTVGITTNFPEAKDVAIHERYLPDKLRAFPRVALRNDDPRRSAVFLAERLAVP